MPLSVQIHAKTALPLRPVRRHRRFLHRESPGNLLYKFICSIPVQVPNHTVIIHNMQLLVREKNCQEIIKFLLPRITRMLLPALQAHLHRGGAAVMPVRNINGRNLLKARLYGLNFMLIPDYPYPVPHAVLRDKITGRCLPLYPCRKLPQHIACPISEKDWARLHIADIHMPDAVLLLVRPGVLMLLNHVIQIIVNGRAGHDPRLAPPVHDLLIKIITGLFLLHKAACGNPLPQKPRRPLIDLGRISVNLAAKARLRTVNGKEGLRILPYGFRRLLPAVHIIRQRRDPALQPGSRAIGKKRSDFRHVFYPPSVIRCIPSIPPKTPDIHCRTNKMSAPPP